MPRGATGVEMRIGLPLSYAYADNRVTVMADDRVVGVVHLERGKEVRFVAGFPAPSRVLHLKADRSIVPPNDRRRLAFALYDIAWRAAGGAVLRRLGAAGVGRDAASPGGRPAGRRRAGGSQGSSCWRSAVHAARNSRPSRLLVRPRLLGHPFLTSRRRPRIALHPRGSS